MAKPNKTGKKNAITTWPLYILLVVAFILYIVYQSNSTLAILFGVITFVVLIALIGLEIVNGSKQEGKLKNALEIIIAIVIVVALWFGMQYILHTKYPIDAVPSCSMLPYLQRGDLILLQGANASTIKAPQVDVTPAQAQNMLNNISQESLECVAYQVNGETINISQIVLPGYSVGLFQQEQTGGYIVPNNSQGDNLVKYQCGVANVVFTNGSTFLEAYTQSITIDNTTITGDHNNSIIVYQTLPQDSFYQDGDSYIVHRVYAVLNADGSYYYLTKGDNNPGLDMQYQNTPVAGQYVEGKVIGVIPYLGYLKLILSGTLSQPAGCNSTLQD